MAYARARSRLTCVRLPTSPAGIAAKSSASPVSVAVRGSQSLSDAEMAWMATLTGPNAVPIWFASPVRSAMPRAEAGRGRHSGRQVQGTIDAEPLRQRRPRRALDGGGCAHRELECLLRMLAAGNHVRQPPGAGRSEQRVARVLCGKDGAVGGGPGEERLADAAQQRGRGVVDASADPAG